VKFPERFQAERASSKGQSCNRHKQSSGDFWAPPAKIRPFTTSTGFSTIWPVANLLPLIWTGQYLLLFSSVYRFLHNLTGCKLVAIHLDWPISSSFLFQVPANFFFIVMTTGQELEHWYVSRFSNVAKSWNATMKQKLRLFAIHQTATSLQRTDNLNPGTKWYPALDESNRMQSAYFTIHPGENPPPQNGCRLKSAFFLKHQFHIHHFPNSTGLFTNIGHKYLHELRSLGWAFSGFVELQ
jgi:hypothetical protein